MVGSASFPFAKITVLTSLREAMPRLSWGRGTVSSLAGIARCRTRGDHSASLNVRNVIMRNQIRRLSFDWCRAVRFIFTREESPARRRPSALPASSSREYAREYAGSRASEFFWPAMKRSELREARCYRLARACRISPSSDSSRPAATRCTHERAWCAVPVRYRTNQPTRPSVVTYVGYSPLVVYFSPRDNVAACDTAPRCGRVIYV